MKKIFFLLSAVVLLAGCGGNNLKRVLVISRGAAAIDKEAKTITINSGTSSEEQTVDFDTKDNIALQVTSQAGKTTLNMDAPGLYVINAKPDTIVGSYQHFGAPAKETSTYKQDFIKQQLDSLQQLIENKNVSAANKNFFILPNHVVKITDNTDAVIVGPFHKLTALDPKDGKTPEVYRFQMVSEVRETIAHLQELTKDKPSPNQ